MDASGKGAATRERIVEQAARLFNEKGFAGASLADIMGATGLQKGGIYRHFETKEALAAEAFDWAVDRLRSRTRAALEGCSGAADRLEALVAVFTELPDHPPVPGGCPIMNAAIESDDGNELLRERSRLAMGGLLGLVVRIVEEGKAAGEIEREVEPEAVATVMVATLEGAVMLARLYGDRAHARHAAEHLERYIRTEVAVGEGAS